MAQVFIKQSLLRLKLDTGISLTDATVKKILWKNPVNGKGSWNVITVEGTSLVYDVTVDDITIPGNWELQSYVEIGGKKGYGDIVIQNFTRNLSE